MWSISGSVDTLEFTRAHHEDRWHGQTNPDLFSAVGMCSRIEGGPKPPQFVPIPELVFDQLLDIAASRSHRSLTVRCFASPLASRAWRIG